MEVMLENLLMLEIIGVIDYINIILVQEKVTMKGNFYVYAHRRLDTGEIFYIGKGTRNRAHDKNARSVYWKRIINKHGLIVEILHDELDEIFALELEANYIACYGRKDLKEGLLINMTDGWEGLSGYKVSQKTRKIHSDLVSGERHPMFGKHHSEKSKQQIKNSLIGMFAGEKHPQYGIKNSKLREQNLLNIGENHPKYKKIVVTRGGYPSIISPEGVLYEIKTSLTQFAKNHNLDQSCLYRLITDKYKSHKGWTLANRSTV